MSTSSTSASSLSFREKLEARIAAVDSLLCVGLDPHEAELHLDNTATEEERCAAAIDFCTRLVQATKDVAVCYKPNAAFFEALGAAKGMETLQHVCRTIIPPEIPILLDVKRGDIGSTAAAYAVACYEHCSADCVTLSPLMGWDSLQPFLSVPGKGAFVLCKTSNPGSKDLLALPLQKKPKTTALLYEEIATLTGTTWKERAHDSTLLGLVVGATDPTALAKARHAAGPGVWILAPGVGAQGGNLQEACQAGLNDQGTGMLIPVSRGISKAADPKQAAQDLVQQIRQVVHEIKQSYTNPTSNDETTTSSSIEAYQKDFIEFSLQQGVLKFGSFVLKSGRTSPYFFNAGLFASGAALFHLGNAYAAAIMAASEL